MRLVTTALLVCASLPLFARAEVTIDPSMLAAFQPPAPKVVASPDNPITPDKVALGRMLYYDKRFSKSQTISCNSCHALDKYGVDGTPTSTGHKNQKGGRNAPTVYHAAGHYAQFWDGRAPNVEVQATMPVLNPIEMAMPNENAVLEVINSIPQYTEHFKKAFPGEANPVNYANFGKAIGAFERGLNTPGRWDKFLAGDKTALTDAEKQGFLTFYSKLCITCHMGTNLGGMIPQKVGLVMPWPNQKDQGRFEVTKNEIDKMIFKVPSLRNIAKTAPYFHDGSVADLQEAVKMMGKHQSGQILSDVDAKQIADFLNALTGDIDMDYIKEPALPPSTDKTPKADLN